MLCRRAVKSRINFFKFSLHGLNRCGRVCTAVKQMVRFYLWNAGENIAEYEASLSTVI